MGGTGSLERGTPVLSRPSVPWTSALRASGMKACEPWLGRAETRDVGGEDGKQKNVLQRQKLGPLRRREWPSGLCNPDNGDLPV